MKLTMKLTLDGLVRAMRWKAHGLAEGVEDGYRREGAKKAGERPPIRRAAQDDRERSP